MTAIPDGNGFGRRFPGMNPEHGEPGDGDASE